MEDLIATQKALIETIATACKCDRENKYEEALYHYFNSIEQLKTLIKYEKNPYLLNTYKKKFKEYLNRAQYIQSVIMENQEPQKVDKILDKEDYSRKAYDEVKVDNIRPIYEFSTDIIFEKPKVKWEEIVGIELIKSTLQKGVILPLKFPQLFVEKAKPLKRILLYGPTGVGKSYIVKGCATEVQCNFFPFSSSDIFLKSTTESERVIISFFEMARANLPAIIYFDNIHLLFSNIKHGENSATCRLKAEFIMQMQKIEKEEGGLFVIGATHKPWELNPEVYCLFEKKIYIPLPSKEARATMFMLNLGNIPHNLTKEHFLTLAQLSKRYSGSNIAEVVRQALMEQLRKCQRAKIFRKAQDGFYEPTSNEDPTGFASTLNELQDPSKVRAPKISFEDIVKLLGIVQPSVMKKDLEHFVAWTTEYGSNTLQLIVGQ